MSDDSSPNDHQAALEALVAEVEREAERVGVDWTVAAERLRAAAPKQTRSAPDSQSSEVVIGLDVTLLLRTLRSLPARAGTAQFLAAITNDDSEL